MTPPMPVYSRPAMRNDVKPVIPSRRPKADAPVGAGAGPGTAKRGDNQGTYDVAGDSAYDDERKPGTRHERGDARDPAGPKPSTLRGGMAATGGAVTDPSGTTGPVSRSSDRLNRTTGKLRAGRDAERSARTAAVGDVNAFAIPTGDSSIGVPILMALLAATIGLLGLIAYWSWPTTSSAPAEDDGQIRVNDVDAVIE